MPKPGIDENRQDFISRCVPEVIKEGYESDQAVAICYYKWQQKDKLAYELGYERAFSFDPSSTPKEGKFNLYPANLLTRHRRENITTGVDAIFGFDVFGAEHLQTLKFDRETVFINDNLAKMWWEENKGQYKFYE